MSDDKENQDGPENDGLTPDEINRRDVAIRYHQHLVDQMIKLRLLYFQLRAELKLAKPLSEAKKAKLKTDNQSSLARKPNKAIELMMQREKNRIKNLATDYNVTDEKYLFKEDDEPKPSEEPSTDNQESKKQPSEKPKEPEKPKKKPKEKPSEDKPKESDEKKKPPVPDSDSSQQPEPESEKNEPGPSTVSSKELQKMPTRVAALETVVRDLFKYTESLEQRADSLEIQLRALSIEKDELEKRIDNLTGMTIQVDSKDEDIADDSPEEEHAVRPQFRRPGY